MGCSPLHGWLSALAGIMEGDDLKATEEYARLGSLLLPGCIPVEA